MKPIRGFALVSALFILIVLVALGAAIVTVTSSQHIGSAQDIEGVRAYQAARAGIEWGLYQVNESGSADNRNCSKITGATPHFPVFGFTVSVTCAQHPDSKGGPTVYSLTATACNQPSSGICPNEASSNSLYIERRLEVVF